MNGLFFNEYAIEKGGAPPEWLWYSAHHGGNGERIDNEVPPSTVRLIGCVPSCTYKSGPRKGRPNFRKPVGGTLRTFWIRDDELESFVAEWVNRTGKCGHCKGDGKEFASWKSGEGTTYRPCRDCNGTGEAAAKGGGA